MSLGQFLPLDDLEKTVTKESVKVELPLTIRIFQSGLPARVAQQAKKVFAILMLIRKPLAIKELLSEGITDEHLPLSRSSEVTMSNILMSKDRKPFRSFAAWKSDAKVEEFLTEQWLVLAPVFDTARRHFILNEKCPLPFLKAEGIGGGYSGVVFRVELHPAHQKGFKAVDGKFRVAVKEYIFKNLDVFNRERQNLEMIHSFGHPHLIQYHATCEIGNRYYIIFPWAAGGDLRKFWGREARRERTAQLALWSLRQMLGLAGALKELHSKNCRHGDLKPEHVLHFSNVSEEVLVIAGVNESRFHKHATMLREGMTVTKASAPSYEAPEVYASKNAPRSRRYDIWSLRFILLEFVIWFLYDFEAIDVFSLARFEADVGSCFYTPTDGGNVEINPKVTEAIEALRQDIRCKVGTGFEALLELIEDNLLQVEVEMRDTADVVATKLENILTKAERNPSYLTNTGDTPLIKPPIFQRPE